MSWLSPDPVFPFEQIAVRNREIVRRLGYAVELRVDEGGIHWPSCQFQGAALDWFFAGATVDPTKHRGHHGRKAQLSSRRVWE